MKINSNKIRGLQYLLGGFSLILKPSIRTRAIIPLLINITLFFSLQHIYYYVLAYFSLESLFTFLTEIFSYLETFFDKNIFKLIIWVLIYPIFILLVTIAFLFTFMFVIPVFLSTLIAGPFNNLLAKEVEEYLTGKKVEIYSEPLLTISSKYIKRKLIKLWYYLKRFIVLIIKTTFISTIPIINILSPKLWFSFTTWLVILA